LAASRAAAASITFWMIDLALAGVFLQPLRHLVGHQAFQRLAHFGRYQLVLGLRGELGIGQLDRDDRGPSRMSSPESETFSFFSMPERSAYC
jgi:hypothetical protein